jgi:transposase
MSTANLSVAVSTHSFAYPYRGIALVFLGVGSLSMVTASISYSKKAKEMLR